MTLVLNQVINCYAHVAFRILKYSFLFQLTSVVNVKRQTNCSTRPKVVQKLKGIGRSDRSIRKTTKHNRDSTLDHYDKPPERQEKIENAIAIFDEEPRPKRQAKKDEKKEEVIFDGLFDDCPQAVVDEINKEVHDVEHAKEKSDEVKPVEKVQEKPDEVKPVEKVQEKLLNDSFEEMFTQHDDEFNSQFEPAKKYLKEMSEERPWNYPSASSSGNKVEESTVNKSTDDLKSTQGKKKRKKYALATFSSGYDSEESRDQESSLKRCDMYGQFLEKERIHLKEMRALRAQSREQSRKQSRT